MICSGKTDYAFSEAEIRALALLMRKLPSSSTAGLETFKCFLETSIYQIMTIAEAEDFFDEKR